MRVGVPKEIKPSEYRVGLTPSAVREYVHRGHHVVVQTGAGLGAGDADTLYKRAGATPGTPQSSSPMPPLCLSRVSAAENTAMRPATSDMGASKGSPPRASVTVS